MRKVLPVSGREWCDKHFRLPAGSSQTAGRWTTMPLQVVPLNMMCNRNIRCVVFQKSARIGYSKILVGSVSCLQAQYNTNVVIYQPTDDDAKDFTIDEIDAAWEMMPIMQRIFPYLFAKNEKNTVKKKVGAGWTLDIKGTHTPKNTRRLTKSALFADEVDGWIWRFAKEGTPIKPARARLEGAAFPMERWGTTPTVAGESHIEVLMSEVDFTFRFYLPCPHCDHEQVLVWGDKDSQHGMKWENTKTSIAAKSRTAHYLCISCTQKIHYNQLSAMEKAGRWIAEDGTWTNDGIQFFSDSNEKVSTPRKVGLHCWAGYSINLSFGWIGLVEEFLSCGGDPAKLQPFVNLVLGELWEGDNAEKLDWEHLKLRREIWWAGDRKENPVHSRACILTGGIDTQDDRVEFYVWAWGVGEECWLVDHIVVLGDLSSDAMQEMAGKQLYNQYMKANGEKMDVSLWCWDAMGHKTDDVYKMSREHGKLWVIPIQGENKYGKPIASFPRKKNLKKVYLTRLGTDGLKERLYGRLNLTPKSINDPVPGCIHFPLDDDICGDEFFKQLCSASKKLEINKSGQRNWRWVKQYHVFDEALDCWNYANAALNILMQRFGFVLTEP
ncbi:terminase gpA endonuclease subunit [Shewanella surugensis]|uniref:Phage terminase large subunit family protein n=1 Tax=Shewanella surugensis TaxID=212020 RepID=A0ABT0L9C4_9GAMM|nr:terminase gpA endonuclease subunit [Shewanella surugensis]MCL1124149.1 phage terminase large subunit family protein [Shewanella surugensis]